MPLSHALSTRERQESKGLVVAVSALQLALVIVVWLLALVPVALMALSVTAFRALKSAITKVPANASAESS